MKNLRVVIFVIIFLVIAVFIGSAIRSWYRFMKEPVSPVVSALPLNTSVVIKSNSVFKLFESINSSALLDLFNNQEGIYYEINRNLDSISVKNANLYELLESSEVLLAFIENKDDKPGLLIVTSIGKTSPGSINNQVKDFLSDQYSISKENNLLYRIDRKNASAWYYVKQGIFALSNDSATLAVSLQSLSSNSNLSQDKSFLKLLATGGKRVDANILINNKVLASSIWPGKSTGLANGTPFDQWTTFDMNIKKSEILLGGFTFTQSEHLFKGQQPVEFNQLEVLPANTAMAVSLSLSDQKKYTGQFLKSDTLHVKGYDASIQQSTDEIFTPGNHLRAWIGNSVSLIFTNGYFKGNMSEQMILIASKDQDSAAYYLKPFIEPINDSLGVLHYSSFAADLWGSIFKLKGKLYCLVTDKYVAISPGRDLLNRYTNNKIKGKDNFTIDKESAGSSSNIFLYIKPETVAKWFARSNRKYDKELVGFLSKNSAIGLQYSAGDDLQYTHAWVIPDPKHHNDFAQVIVKEKEEKITADTAKPIAGDSKKDSDKNLVNEKVTKSTKRSGGLFSKKDKELDQENSIAQKETNIKTGLRPPQVVSGINKNKKQIAVLTEKGQLNMYDSQGRLLWNFKSSGPPSSPIIEVDYQRNGKTHYLIATKQHMHILGPEGKEVKGSPIKLPAPVLGEISVFDYDNNKDYRLLYTATNHQIYNITLKGVELPDWQKPKVNGNGNISFYRTNGKDYLVYQYKDEALRIFDRRGKERIKISNQVTFSEKSTLFENKTNSKGIFLTITKTGELVYINSDGLISKSYFGKFDNNPWFCYTDFDADGSMDFIFAGKDKIVAYNRMKEVITSKAVKDGLLGIPFVYSSSSKDTWIFARNARNDEIIGLHNSGRTLNNKNIKSDTDPIVFNPGGSLKEILVTTKKGKLVLTSLDRL